MVNEHILMYQQRIGITIGALAEEVRCVVSLVFSNPLVTFRVKDPEILAKKMQLKGVQSVFSIDDVYGIRIIVESVNDAYKVLDKISRVFPGHLDHDYLKDQKPGPSVGGKVLRLLQFIAYRNEASFEIQITTVAFNEVNEQLHYGYYLRKYRS